jgi:predicted nucleic acid-binding protein
VKPQRIFLDTNVFIIGSTEPSSPEASILEWLGFFGRRIGGSTVVVSDVLIEQVVRVGRRIRGKDYSGELIARLWQNLSVEHVTVEEDAWQLLSQKDVVPREDISIFLTAMSGSVECFVSANHKLIKALATTDQLFECLTPIEFVAKYIESNV